MFKAVLFDLDGTLLDIDMDMFLNYYFQAMAQSAQGQGYKYPKKLVEQVYRSTDVMMATLNADITNEQAFMEDFLAACAYPEMKARQFFDSFYRDIFPTLKKHCRPLPGCRELVGRVFELGCQVVIATNPVFPMAAVEHRLNWAGIGDFPFDLVTSYENMHYTKPHPEFFLEISELMGVDPKDCLMVGNDIDEDLPAGIVGMRTCLVENMLIDKGHTGLVPDWRGRFEDLMRFIEGQL